MSRVSQATSLLFRALLFFLAFTAEVRVHAAEGGLTLPLAHELQTEPENCQDEDGLCAMHTAEGERAILNIGESTVTLDQDTALVRENLGELRLVSGTIWLKSGAALSVRTEFGTVRAAKGQELWLSRDNDRVTVSVTAGEVTLEPRGSSEKLLLPAGFENSIGRVGKDGKAVTGLPTAMVLQDHLLRWARLYSGRKKQFEAEATEFKKVWENAARDAALIHQKLHERKVASIEADQKRREDSRKKTEKQNRELREMLRHKTFDP